MKVGVIGLGQIGGGIALRLARQGMLSAVFDVRADAATGLDGVPALSSGPGAVARASDLVIVAVVDAAQARAVLTGDEGILACAAPQLPIILMATVSLPELDQLRGIVEAGGCTLVDCGVSGGQRVRDGGLVCLVGAAGPTFRQVEPTLAACAKSVLHVGGPGAGMAAKIARNVIVYGCLRAGYEGVALARAAGIDVAQFLRAVEDSAEGVGGPTMLMAYASNPDLTASLPRIRAHVRLLLGKDLHAALALGRDAGIALPLAELTLATVDEVTGAADGITGDRERT